MHRIQLVFKTASEAITPNTLRKPWDSGRSLPEQFFTLRGLPAVNR